VHAEEKYLDARVVAVRPERQPAAVLPLPNSVISSGPLPPAVSTIAMPSPRSLMRACTPMLELLIRSITSPSVLTSGSSV
jgi:hypothetical protein